MVLQDCLYYRATVKKIDTVRFVSLLRSMEDALCFDRIEKKELESFEFFVPFGMNERFLKIMSILMNENLCSNLQEKDIQKSSLFNYEE